jgi:aminoglycoside 2'-N-acetyltransferase I
LRDYRDVTQPAAILELPTNELTAQQNEQLRRLLWDAFDDDVDGRFTEEDWKHRFGGTSFIAELGGEIVAHAAVVERELRVAGRPLRTGYVEAVAVAPQHQGRGHGTAVMRAVGALIARDFEIGALGTGKQGFYERLGWHIWRGPSSVRTPHGERLTPDEDGYIMVLLPPGAPPIDLTSPISCEWRPGDVW